MDAIIIENFFDNFENIKEEFKKIPLLTLDEMNEKFKHKDRIPETWPGERSEALHETNKFLFNLVVKELTSKTDLFNKCNFNIDARVHLRLGSDNHKDFIHSDPNDYTLIIYLSDTNLKSGTALYTLNSNDSDVMVNFKQNRAFLFKGHMRHMATQNYGENIENGRLTLNCFIKIQR